MSQSGSRLLIFFLPILLTPVQATANSQYLSVPIEHELEECASRLRIQPGNLHSARRALCVATETVGSLPQDRVSQSEFAELMRNWYRLQPENVTSVARFLVERLRRQAATAPTAGSYERTVDRAFQLLSHAEALDPESVRQIVEAWPESPDGLAALEYPGLADQAVESYLRLVALRDPQKALEELRKFDRLFPSLEVTFEIEMLITRELLRRQVLEDPTEAIRSCFDRFRATRLTVPALVDFRRGLYFVAHLDGELFVEGFKLLTERLAQLPPENEVPACPTPTTGDPSPSNRESQQLEALAYVRNQPGLVEKAIESLPRLAAFLSDFEEARKREEAQWAATHEFLIDFGGTYRGPEVGDIPPWPFGGFTSYGRGFVFEPPPSVAISQRSWFSGSHFPTQPILQGRRLEEMKSRLRSDFATPERFDILLQIARYSNVSEIRREAVRLAENTAASTDSLPTRLELTGRLLPARRAAFGEVGSARIEAAARLLEEATKASWSQDDEPRAREAISALERILLLESAFLDTDKSLASALAVDDSQRLSLLLDLIRVLSR